MAAEDEDYKLSDSESDSIAADDTTERANDKTKAGDNTTRPVKNDTKAKATQRVGAYIKKEFHEDENGETYDNGTGIVVHDPRSK